MAEAAIKMAKDVISADIEKNSSQYGKIAAAITFAAFGFLYLFFTWKFDYWSKKGYFHLKPVPFLGNFGDLFLFKKSIGEFMRDIYLENPYCEAVGLWLFRRPVIVLRNSELIKRVLIKDFDCFRDRTAHVDPIYDPIGFGNLFMIKSTKWRPLRAQLSPLFTGNKMKMLTKEIQSHALHLIKRVKQEHVEKRQPAELKELCALFTTDVIGSAAWGVDAQALASPDSSHMRLIGKKLFTYNLRRSLELTGIFFAPEIAKLCNFKVFSSECSTTLRSTFWKVMKERENDMKAGRPTRTGDLIETLIQLKNNPPSDGLEYSDDTLVAQAVVFFTAGYETSSSALSFTLYELAFRPDLQEKAFEEVNTICEGSPENLTNEAIGKMTFLDMCIKESLRKYPPLPFLDRLCVKDFTWHPTDPELKPITIEKGTPVYIPMLGIHMDPTIHHNPQDWDPERFSADRKSDGSHLNYFPFGSGPRNCIGERFGLMQTKFGLAALILSFTISPAPKSVHPSKITIDKKAFTYQSKELLNVCFTCRS